MIGFFTDSRRSALGARRSALGSRLPALGSRRSALGSRRSALGARRSALGSRLSAPLDGRRKISIGGRLFGFVRLPYKDLRLEDVTVVLDKASYPAVSLIQQPQDPGHYILAFTPPDEYRDGENHLVEVRLRLKRGTARMPMTLLFPRPSAGVHTAIPDLFLFTPDFWVEGLSR